MIANDNGLAVDIGISLITNIKPPSVNTNNSQDIGFVAKKYP